MKELLQGREVLTSDSQLEVLPLSTDQLPSPSKRMEERGTSGGLLNMNTTSTRETEMTATSAINQISLGTTNATYCFNMTFNLNLLKITIALFGLAANAIVLWFLSLRRNAFTVYILNLAGADFLFLGFAFAYSVEQLIYLTSSVLFYEEELIPLFFNTMSTFTYIAGLSILSAISTERCLSVLCPIWYRCHRPRHLSAAMCILLWVLSLLMATLEGNYCGFLFTDFSYKWCKVFDFLTFGWLTFLFVVLSGSSLMLVAKILCSSRRIPLTSLYMVILFTVLAFLLFGLPFGIYWFLLFWIENYLKSLFCDIPLVLLVLSAINSSINPIIYFLVGSFRKRQWRGQRPTLRLCGTALLGDFNPSPCKLLQLFFTALSRTISAFEESTFSRRLKSAQETSKFLR
ncbi:mas-related G-protein coupled receptor member X2-like [Tupaia chinensis]|uniref:mas-related G-protein coupled receptor member X2-like n=1 Tax=Tupaia chinensis TaxID=246437 RepID=UPI000FFC56B1|nr:mas-related G-protein coupled receptor member X2-like [Tupaia chinensis]